MEYKCNICNKLYSSYQSLWIHNRKYHTHNTIITNQLQSNDQSSNNQKCKYCNKIFSHYNNKWRHEKTCKNKVIEVSVITELKKEITELKNMITTKNTTNNLETKLNFPINNHLIDIIVNKSNTIIDLKNENTELKENNITNNLIAANIMPTTLTLNDVVIVSRTEDNYINATHLCQAGGKQFNDWYRLNTTKELITVLEVKTGIPVLELIEVNKGGNHLGSWVHPDLAIQLAQWISPIFAIQVSSWIRTLFTNGNVSIDVKILEDQHSKEIELKDQKIQLLQDIYIKKQKRSDYPEKNVIYILSTEDNKKKRIYILGKTKKLKDRLGPYNKTAEHGVEYYKSCNSKENMNIAESMVLSKLDKYREKANRDRFILPVENDLILFTDIIENCINFLIK
jgi:hypothetical protein